MTINITIADLYGVLKNLQQDPEGFVSMKEFTSKAAEAFKCVPLSVRNFVIRNQEYFEQKHGFIREKIPATTSEQAEDQKIYQEWLTKREAVLDESIKFLSTLTPTPVIDNILVACATARDELASYTDSRLQELLLTLKREFNFTPSIGI